MDEMPRKHEDLCRCRQAQLADRGLAAVDPLPEEAFDPIVLHAIPLCPSGGGSANVNRCSCCVSGANEFRSVRP